MSRRTSFIGFLILLVFIFLVLGSTAFCFSTEYYSVKAPPGWHEEPDAFDSDVVMGGPLKPDLATPMISIVTRTMALGPQTDLKKILKSSIENKYGKIPGVTNLKITKWGKVGGTSRHLMAEFEYSKDGVPQKNIVVIYAGAKTFHLLNFSTTSKYFDDYAPGVLKTASSFEFKK